MSVLALYGVGKTYTHYERVIDRLLESLFGGKRHREFTALHPVTIEIARGEVLGLVGMNGAGKSTLLKLIAQTILPSSGKLLVNGRISALLELGAGFHPEMSGRENVYLSGTVMGLSIKQIDTLYDSIVEFSGMGEFMAQPVKTYSSGMFMRLAFSVATSIQPDILIIDEALSVGDGAFARKSFERIMCFKEAGGTILFCSHSLYQVEAICSRVLWMHHGKVVMDGAPEQVTASYAQFLDTGLLPDAQRTPVSGDTPPKTAKMGMAHLQKVEVTADGIAGNELEVQSKKTDVAVSVRMVFDPTLAIPTLAIAFVRPDGSTVASAGTLNDGIVLNRNAEGSAEITVVFPRLSLLKGEYWVSVYLLCERGIHLYEEAPMIVKLMVNQQGLEQGLVSLPHTWIPALIHAAG